MAEREDGFTLVELLVVVILIAILAAIAIGAQLLARERASDATAKSNIRIAVPAIESYHADNSSYAGMTVPILQNTYSPGVQGIEILSADETGYCLKSTVGGRSWYKDGPAAPITMTSCA